MSVVETEPTVVAVNLSEEERARLHEAAEWKWPETKMSEAEIILSLAKMAGGCVLKKKKAQAE